jgi:hypothetical protein
MSLRLGPHPPSQAVLRAREIGSPSVMRAVCAETRWRATMLDHKRIPTPPGSLTHPDARSLYALLNTGASERIGAVCVTKAVSLIDTHWAIPGIPFAAVALIDGGPQNMLSAERLKRALQIIDIVLEDEHPAGQVTQAIRTAVDYIGGIPDIDMRGLELIGGRYLDSTLAAITDGGKMHAASARALGPQYCDSLRERTSLEHPLRTLERARSVARFVCAMIASENPMDWAAARRLLEQLQNVPTISRSLGAHINKSDFSMFRFTICRYRDSITKARQILTVLDQGAARGGRYDWCEIELLARDEKWHMDGLIDNIRAHEVSDLRILVQRVIATESLFTQMQALVSAAKPVDWRDLGSRMRKDVVLAEAVPRSGMLNEVGAEPLVRVLTLFLNFAAPLSGVLRILSSNLEIAEARHARVVAALSPT